MSKCCLGIEAEVFKEASCWPNSVSAKTQASFPTGFNSTYYAMLKAFENPTHLLRTGLLTKNLSLLPLRGESFPCGKENIRGAASFPLLHILSAAWV